MGIQKWCFATSVLTLGCCGVAGAQAVNGGAEINGADQPQMAEVLVTAERRHTDAQHTPISATILSGSELSNLGVSNVDSLQFATPGATIDNFGQGIDFNIRGVGKSVNDSQTT